MLASAGLDHGLSLLALDVFAGMAGVIGVLTMAGKMIFKSGKLSLFVDKLVEWFGPTVGTVEEIATTTGAASTFITIGAHGVAVDWWR